MPIQIEWENDDKTLIRWNFVGRWTEQQLHETIERSNGMITAQDHTVNHVIDFSRAEGLNANLITETRYGISQMPANLGQVVIITEGRAVELIAEAIQRFSWFNNDKIHFAKSDAEAHAYFEAL